MATLQPPNLENRLELSVRARVALGVFAAVASTTHPSARGEIDQPKRRGFLRLFDLATRFASNELPPCPWPPLGAAVVPDWDLKTRDAILRCEHPGHCWTRVGAYYPCE